ncbi:MAG: hypothetical protein ACRC1H_13040, partial [Caldilineaceae bacterium]
PRFYLGASGALTTGDARMVIGLNRAGSGHSYLDFVGDTTYTSYGLRVWRGNGGANATSYLTHRGTGPLQISTQESGDIVFITNNNEDGRFDASAGKLDLTLNLRRDGVDGYIYVPITPIELTDAASNLWDGGATKDFAVATYDFDLNSASNGTLPSDAKAAVVWVSGTWTAAGSGSYALVKKNGALASDAAFNLRAYVANMPMDAQGTVELDSGQIFEIEIVGATMNQCACRLIGYYI